VNSGNRVLDSTARLAIVAVTVTALAVLALGRLASAGSSASPGGARAGAPPSTAAAPAAPAELAVTTPAMATPAPPTPATAASNPAAALEANPTPSECAITRPGPAFTPPKPYLASPPNAYDSVWYGNAHLWTMLDIGGETWGPWLFATPPGLPQKTFWWSADWHPEQTGEWEPAITVTGRRLDGPETFKFGPGTNASADFGTAMLVGIDIPSYGCWELTADYRGVTLSYVVSVINP